MKSVSGKEFCKLLEKRGWTWDRTNGSHRIYEPPEHLEHLESVSIPVHANKTLRKGTQIALMKKASIEASDL